MTGPHLVGVGGEPGHYTNFDQLPKIVAVIDELDEMRWLVSAAGDAEIRLAGELLVDHDLVTATARLRKRLTATQTRLVLEQVRLRQRARKKFDEAERADLEDRR